MSGQGMLFEMGGAAPERETEPGHGAEGQVGPGRGERPGRRVVMGPVPIPRLAAREAADLARVRGLGTIFASYDEVPDLDIEGLAATAEASRLFWEVVTPALDRFVASGETPASWERIDSDDDVRIVLRGVSLSEARGLWASVSRSLNKGEGGPGIAVADPAFDERNAAGAGAPPETHIVFWPKDALRDSWDAVRPPVRFRTVNCPGYRNLLDRHGDRPYFADGWLWIRRGADIEGYRIGGLQVLLFPEGREALEAVARRQIEDYEAEIQRLFRKPHPIPGVREAAAWKLRCKIDSVKRWIAKLSAYDLWLDLVLAVFEAFHRQRDAWAAETLGLPDGRTVETKPWRVILLDPADLRARLDPGRTWGRNWRRIIIEKLHALATFERQVRDGRGRKFDVGDRFLTRVVDCRRGVDGKSAPPTDCGPGLTRILKAAGAFPMDAFLVEVSVEFMSRFFSWALDEKGRARWGSAAAGAASRAHLAQAPDEKAEAHELASAKRREARERTYYDHSPRLLAVGNLERWPLSRKLLACALLQEVTPNFATRRDRRGRNRRSRIPNRLGGRQKLVSLDGREYVACNGSSDQGYRLATWLKKAGYRRDEETAGEPCGEFAGDLAALARTIGLRIELHQPGLRGAPGPRRDGDAVEVIRSCRARAARDLALKLYLPADLEERLRARLARAGIDAVDEAPPRRSILAPARPGDLAPVDIRIARRRAGWTQRELARRVGVSQKTVSRWENGQKPLTRRRSAQLSRLLEPHLTGPDSRPGVTESGDFRPGKSQKVSRLDPKSHR